VSLLLRGFAAPQARRAGSAGFFAMRAEALCRREVLACRSFLLLMLASASPATLPQVAGAGRPFSPSSCFEVSRGSPRSFIIIAWFESACGRRRFLHVLHTAKMLLSIGSLSSIPP